VIVLKRLTVACLDVGSVKRKSVGWAVLGSTRSHGSDLKVFVDTIVSEARLLRPIALGFECPLYVPRRSEPIQLTGKRLGEIGVNWCGGPGAAVLATGLVEVRWVLDRLVAECPNMRGTTRLSDFDGSVVQLLIWEAFVTKKAGPTMNLRDFRGSRGKGHERDALAGALACVEKFEQSGGPNSDLEREDSASIAGGHLISSGLSSDLRLLHEQCLVVMAKKP
jgi:hypothetical protein